ncbi:hypothetical protein PVK06_041955 [Gossypium arboreum]|uniref:Uncharacterized protein n=1 Tax=Gossypium arboreum TaxID=29729 RepID=A0ABR0N9N4_GOSAR|nr:hypothetical protein PVK06_041955 [Gossypium arboreum]
MGHLMLQIEQGKGVDEFDNGEHGIICDIVAQDNLRLLPGHKLGGKADVREPLYGDLRGTTTDIGKRLLGFTPFGGGAIEMELPHVSTIGSNIIFGAFGNNIEMGGRGKFRGSGKRFGH